jgi:hypothetical protein
MGLLPPGVGGELVSVTIRKPASLSIVSPSSQSEWAGMVFMALFSASTSSVLVATLWMAAHHLEHTGTQGPKVVIKARQGYRHGIHDEVAKPLTHDPLVTKHAFE